MEVQGLVHVIGETQEIGNNGFTKRLLVVETQEQYKQTIPIDFVKDKTFLLDNYVVGQEVKVSINLRGNEYNGKYYCNIQGWRIETVNTAPKQNTPPLQSDEFTPQGTEPDDMPY
jgi:hypothetical protein